MPRRDKVSRTIRCTVASAVFLNLNEKTPLQRSVILPGVLTETQASKKIVDNFTNENQKFVTIKELRYTRCRFTMDLIDFIKVAFVNELKEKEKEI